MYNPWSIISYMNRSGTFDVYWANTGNNDLIKQLILNSNNSIKEQFEQLMQGEALTLSIISILLLIVSIQDSGQQGIDVALFP